MEKTQNEARDTVSSLGQLNARMRQVRTAAGVSQLDCATSLGVSHRAYQSYEMGQRDTPLKVVIAFAARFDRDLSWLIEGKHRLPADNPGELAEQVVQALYRQTADKAFTPQRFGRVTRYVLEQCIAKGTMPEAEVSEVLSIMED